jgi:hypothetical protein
MIFSYSVKRKTIPSPERDEKNHFPICIMTDSALLYYYDTKTESKPWRKNHKLLFTCIGGGFSRLPAVCVSLGYAGKTGRTQSAPF